jgi:hypothetical protein
VCASSSLCSCQPLATNVLFRYKIDFRKATSAELGLISVSDCNKHITFEKFVTFLTPFADLQDSCTSPRYHYGELRLTRLNWLVRIFLGKLTFHHIHAQWGSCLNRILTPFIMVFVILSTILNTMQVELAAQSLPYEPGPWTAFSKTSRWFSVIVLFLSALILFAFVGLILFMFFHDQWFARAVLREKRKSQVRAALEMKSGVV